MTLSQNFGLHNFCSECKSSVCGPFPDPGGGVKHPTAAHATHRYGVRSASASCAWWSFMSTGLGTTTTRAPLRRASRMDPRQAAAPCSPRRRPGWGPLPDEVPDGGCEFLGPSGHESQACPAPSPRPSCISGGANFHSKFLAPKKLSSFCAEKR